ncbi:MAG: hypothetical protein WC876_08600 [Candidatus Thermoplasmatota archaeon]|jgi:hypothetical protein
MQTTQAASSMPNKTPDPLSADHPLDKIAARKRAFHRNYCQRIGCTHDPADIAACVAEAQALEYLNARGFAFTRRGGVPA